MAKVDLHFVNGSQPALSADNMNKIVDAVNDNDDGIKSVRDDLTKIIDQKIPESIVADIVDDYVEEHQAGLEPKARKMSYADFDKLSPKEKEGVIHVTDRDLQNDLINDSVTSGSKTWSSQKIQNEISNNANTLFTQGQSNFDNTSLNSFTDNGCIAGYFNNITLGNKTFSGWGMLLVTGINIKVQVALCGGNIATRRYSSGSWSSWT